MPETGSETTHAQCAKEDCRKPAISTNRIHWIKCRKCNAAWHLSCLPRGSSGSTGKADSPTVPHFKRRQSRKGTVEICPSCEPFEFEASGLINRYHRTRSFSMDQMFTTSFLEDWNTLHDDDDEFALNVSEIEPGGRFLDTPSSPEVYSLTCLSSARSRRSQSLGSLHTTQDEEDMPNGRIVVDQHEDSASDGDATPNQSTQDLRETTSVPEDEVQDQPGELRVEWSTSVSQSDDEPNQLGASPPGEGIYQRRRYASLKSPNRRRISAPVVRRQSMTAGTQTEMHQQKIPDRPPLVQSQRSFSVCGTLAALLGRTRFASASLSNGFLSKSLDERALRMARDRQEGEQGILDRWRARRYSQWIWEKWDSAINLMRQKGWVCIYVSRNTRRLRSAHGRPCFKIEGSQRVMTTERQEELKSCWTSDVTLIRAYFVDYPMRLERDIASVLISSYQWEYKWFSCFRKDQICGIGHRNEWLGLKSSVETADVAEMLTHLDEVCKGWLKEYNCDLTKTQRYPVPDKYCI